MTLSLGKTRRLLRREKIDGWLFHSFQGSDPLALRLLGLAGRFHTRRWFYYVPADGTPTQIVHRIEPEALEGLPGRREPFASREELTEALRKTLRGARRVAMQYSPKSAVPALSRVDAGTVELVRAAGPAVVSSGDLVQSLEAVLTPAQKTSHRRAARDLHQIVHRAFAAIRRDLRANRSIGELDVQRRILRDFAAQGLVTNAPPIVAAGAHSALPHYTPSPSKSARIKKGDWVLIDLWAKGKAADDIYADITWCAYAGANAPTGHEEVFQTVRRARDAAVDAVRTAFAAGREIRGWQVDRAARSVVERAGHGKNFTHRTGHSIHTEDHADGANMDSFETREERRLMPDTLFSVEPGIYLPGRFGARSEINVLLDGRRVEITTPVQEKIVTLL